MRTARSRTSGENLFDFFMAQSSQRFEPPQNTGRFILLELQHWFGRGYYIGAHSLQSWEPGNYYVLLHSPQWHWQQN
jgi:hypothetical protein